MRAAILTDIRHVEIQELPVRKPGPGEVLIRVRAAGICGAELHAFIGTHPFRKPPIQMGHEMAGDVEEVGPAVVSVVRGDHVSVLPGECGRCSACKEGAPNLCENKIHLGTAKWPGCFADYIIAPEASVFKVPSHVSHQEAAIAEPLSVAIHAVQLIHTTLGSSVAILGAGTIGLGCVAVAREAGATSICVTDVMDFNLEASKRFGASLIVNAGRKDPVAEIRAATDGRGVDAVLIAVGFAHVLDQAISMVRPKGTVVVVALFDDIVAIRQFTSFMVGEKTVKASWASTPQDFRTAIDLIASGRIKAKDFITHRLPLEKTKEGLELLEKKNEDCIKVMLDIG